MNYCESCFEKATYFGEIFEGHDLIRRKDGLYSIVNEHDELYRFSTSLAFDPIPNGLSMAEYDKLYADANICDADDIYLNACEQIGETFRFNPEIGHMIYKACEKSGWDSKNVGSLTYWIMDRAARLVYKK